MKKAILFWSNNNSKYLLITFSVSGTMLSSLHANSCNSSMERCYSYLHFTKEVTDAPRG